MYRQVSLLDWDNQEYVAIYNNFKIGSEDENYKLTLSGYDETLSTMPDGFSIGNHIGAEFTTSDRDNDDDLGNNCASTYSGGLFN